MATLVLVIWPIIAIVLFSRLGRIKGLILSVMVGYLFLPENYAIAIPGFVDYDKVGAVTLGALLGLLISAAPKPPDPQTASAADQPILSSRLMLVLVAGCMVLIVSGIVLTWLTNRETLVYTQRVLPAISMYDAVSILGGTIIIVTPYFLARRYLTKPEHHHYVLVALLALGLFYSLLALWEIRMSPHLHTSTYGYFQHNWGQHVRSGGFRPLVFLRHSLWLGFFLVTVFIAALALARRSSDKLRIQYLFAAFWVYAVIILSKNFGAILLGTAFGLMIWFVNLRMLIKVCAVLSIVFLIFPAARQANLVPIDSFISVATRINADRIGSFEFRLMHEDAILARALEKPVAGWGPWARWRVRDERGRDETVSDGLWIIIIGERGWIGYIGFFGLLVLPVVMLAYGTRKREVSIETAAISTIMTANFIYLVPNSTLSPIGWLIAGSLAGFVQYSYTAPHDTAPDTAPDTAAPPLPVRRRQTYSRFQPKHARPQPSAQR